jgi:hypothetical protein
MERPEHPFSILFESSGLDSTHAGTPDFDGQRKLLNYADAEHRRVGGTRQENLGPVVSAISDAKRMERHEVKDFVSLDDAGNKYLAAFVSGQLTPAGTPKGLSDDKPKATINDRMHQTLLANLESVDWTVKQWAQHLGTTKGGAITETKAWADIIGLREARRVERVVSRRTNDT